MLKIRNQRHYSLLIDKNNRYLAAFFQSFIMHQRILLRLLLSLVFFTFAHHLFAQPAWTINLLDSTKRSKKFEERKLGSEKMAEKKFTKVRRVFQNNFTHYNYYYNAHNKINAVIEKAKMAQKDDYTKLLTYYGYTLDNTAMQKIELDSVIFKATAGILLHDLRNDWIDNMYLLMGEAYFFKKDFDSAAATFQFINYNLFPRKKNEDDSHIVGTRNDNTTSSNLSIANKEKPNLLQRLTAQPPSRNDALVWMIRALIEQNEFGDAASLINTLQHDPNLPLRLVNDLDEINAYWFFKQNLYDSTATYLEKALTNAPTRQDKARSQFLLAQLFEITHQYDKATIYYNSASKNTIDPLMDIYAQLNNAKMMKVSDPVQMEKSILNLAHMAKKDKFESYRDIIFYSAGDLSLQKPDTSEAVFYYTKSLQYNVNNIHFKNKAYLQLASIAYDRKQYRLSFAMYDSLQSGDTTLTDQLAQIQDRRNALSKIVDKLIIIDLQDSLQKLAAMTVADRTAFVTALVKRLHKEQGVKEQEEDNGSMPISFDKKNEAPDLFAGDNSKDEWYFYNASARAKGLGDFKRRWGTRTNSDNWARKSAGESGTKNNGLTTPPDGAANDLDAAPGGAKNSMAKANSDLKATPPQNISFDGLMANIPLTPEQLQKSNALLSTNVFELAKLYQTALEDYPQAIITYDDCLQRFPDSLFNGDIYLGLYYCYNKLGNTEKAAYYKNLLNTKFATSHANKLLNNTLAPNATTKTAEGTKRYSDIYNLFIEGKFDEALAQKKKADSSYGTNYWSPQLLYIEAVYDIKQHNDSTAMAVLANISGLYPASPLAPKAERMIDVLKRRKEIESYLTALQVTRATDDTVLEAPLREKLVRNDQNLIVTPKRFDSSKTAIPKTISPIPGRGNDSAKTPAPLLVAKDSVKSKIPLTVVAKDSIKSIAAAPAKTAITKNNIKNITPLPQPAIINDTTKNAAPVLTNGPFTFNAALPQSVIMVLDKVDGTYVNESRNAFLRYVTENFRDQTITVTKDGVDKDISLLIFTSFANADDALQFLTKIKKAAPDEVSWLPPAKYSFLLISDTNLQLLKINKNLKEYKALLSKQYPGKF